MLRTSERLSFKTCEQRWHWNFNDRRKSRDEKPALRFGDLIHRSLERYYKPGLKRGTHPAKTFEKLYHKDLEAELLRLRIKTPDDEWLDALDLGIGMLKRYVDQFADRDDEYEVLASEQTFQVPILDPDTGELLTVYVGTFDGIWRKLTDRTIWFKEFKTTGSSVPEVLRGLPMDEQAGSYWTFGPDWLHERGILKPKQDLDGILYTIFRKSIPNPDWNFNHLGQRINLDGSVSKTQPGQYFGRQPVFRDEADKAIMRERVVEEARRMAALRAQPDKVIKNPGPLFMPNCKFCEFRDVCELHETGGDWQAMMKQTTMKWDPYEAHEILAGDRV
jgi:hypothetical protein